MKKSTSTIVRAALAADESLRTDQKAAALSILSERGQTLTPLLVTAATAAKLLGVSRTYVWRLCRDKKIEAVKVLAGATRFRFSDLQKFAGGPGK